MNLIWSDMMALLKQKENCVMATIVDQSGSAPRTSGAHMIVKEDLSIIGTVGGGKLEAETIAVAQKVFKTKQSDIHSFFLTGKDASETDMICGGAGEILLDYWAAENNRNLLVLDALLRCLKEGKKAWLITGIEKNGSRQQCLVEQGGTVTGDFQCDQSFYLRMISGPAKLSIHSEVLESMRVFIEPIEKGSDLFIFGAGHVSQKIAPIAEQVGFNTIVIDDRPEFANAQRFAKAKIRVVQSLENPLPELGIDPESYVVIVTRGHLHDKTILDQVMRTAAGYIGMIGSRHKRDLLYKNLANERGYAIEDFSRVHCPIGLEIFAESPEEIAVSIVAELIKVRAQKSHG